MPFTRAAVVSHLGRDARLFGYARDESRLANVVRERLLAVDVLPRLHSENRDEGVQVVGSGDEDGIDRLFLLEHHPEIFVRRAGEVRRLGRIVRFDLLLDRPAARLARVVPVREIPLLCRIGQRDDLAIVLLEERARVGPPLSARPDDGDVDLVAGRDEAGAAQDVPGYDGKRGRGGGRRRDELSASGGRLGVHDHPCDGPCRAGDARIID